MDTTTEINAYNAQLAESVEWLATRDALAERALQVPERIETQQDVESAAALQSEIRAHVKALNEKRMNLTRQLDTVKKSLIAQEREMIQPIDEQLTRIKGVTSEYATRKAKEAEEERRRIMEEERKRQEAEARASMEAEDVFGSPVAMSNNNAPQEPVQLPPEKQKVAGARTVKRWSFTVVNPAAVPGEYKSVDEAKICAYVQFAEKMKTDPVIPGVQFESRISVE